MLLSAATGASRPTPPPERVHRHDLVRVLEQDRQHRALLDPAERDRTPAVDDLQRAEDAKVHGRFRPTVPLREARRQRTPIGQAIHDAGRR